MKNKNELIMGEIIDEELTEMEISNSNKINKRNVALASAVGVIIGYNYL